MSPSARTPGGPSATSARRTAFHFGAFTYLPDEALLLRDGVAVRVGSRALDILGCLVEQAGEVVEKQAMARHVWPTTVVEEVSLRVHLMALRKALGDGENGARFIINVPGRGYRFVAPVHRVAPANGGPAAPALAHASPLRDALKAMQASDLSDQEVLQALIALVVTSLSAADQAPARLAVRA